MFGVLDGLPGGADIILVAAREATDYRNVTVRVNGVTDLDGDGFHGLEVVLRRRGKSGFDDIHAELRQLASDVQLLLRRQRSSRRLLAVAERRVEDPNVLRVRNSLRHVLRPIPPEAASDDGARRRGREAAAEREAGMAGVVVVGGREIGIRERQASHGNLKTLDRESSGKKKKTRPAVLFVARIVTGAD